MRAWVCVIAFIALLLFGFLATPGLFKLINPDYLIALHDHSPQRAKLSQDIADLEPKLAELNAKIADFDLRISTLVSENLARAATMAVQNVPANEMVAIMQEYGRKISELKHPRDQAAEQKKALEDRGKFLRAARATVEQKIESAAKDSANIYIVARALALGAVGALLSIFVKFLSTANTQNFFAREVSLGRIGASMAMGAVVSVVVIGLFFTGFISIFSQAEQNSGTPDFWKVTILCLIAGAFSERLFQTASSRMDKYLAGPNADDGKAVANNARNRVRGRKQAKAS